MTQYNQFLWNVFPISPQPQVSLSDLPMSVNPVRTGTNCVHHYPNFWHNESTMNTNDKF